MTASCGLSFFHYFTTTVPCWQLKIGLINSLTIGPAMERIVPMKHLSAIVIFLFILSGLTGCGREVKGMKEEIKLLKEENSFLKAENAGLKKEIEHLYTKLEEKVAPIHKVDKPEESKPKK
jgi:hypothetical protein